MTQVESSIMFAGDAIESLCRYKNCEDVQSEDGSSVSITIGSTTPRQIGSPSLESEQALVALHTDLISNRSVGDLTHQSMIQVGTGASHIDDTEYYAQLSHGCSVSAVGSPARAGTVCPRFHRMFALTHFPIRTSACSLQYIGLTLP
jgi:hypothetical protein